MDLTNYQHLFNTDIKELATLNENDVQYIEQNHFGDMLVETSEDGNERYKLWRNLDCNVAEGENLIEVEYCGKLNSYSWETVFTYNG